MLDTKSVYALNKADKTTIVCPSVTGEHIRLTREDFASEEEFAVWKAWSDEDYHITEIAGQKDSRCLSIDAQRDAPAPSVEEIVLAPYIAEETAEQRRLLLERIKSSLTETQYRRLCLYYLDGKNELEIASLEGVNQSNISRSINSGKKVVEKFLKKFLRGTA